MKLTTWLKKATLSVGEVGSEIWPQTNKGPESEIEVSGWFEELDMSVWLRGDAVWMRKSRTIQHFLSSPQTFFLGQVIECSLRWCNLII